MNLRCEYRQNPLGIDTLQPRLSWTLEPTDPKVRDQRQTAYQILAASSEERLRSDQGNLWDTGQSRLREVQLGLAPWAWRLTLSVSRLRETCTSVSMSRDGRRGGAPLTTAPTLDSTENTRT